MDKKEQKVLLKLFRQGKAYEGFELIVNMMIENNKDEVVFKKLIELYDYFVHNKEGLVPYKLRDNINMNMAPEGVEYRQLGTMEHNICAALAHRMKGRK
ncbi:hypothetical protein [Clostridium algidicarnis]|uniref:hypothetical protein n=1 Tax=Clostridium algidicarnis TaxID=37659 RepID=UPI001C0DFAE5|nr:hypothetical protein [Clostridium algidicarnis]MBU3209052.1 hypothetical protein [Clostridium algidicarnis]MBU3228774.1 hypothetical protein [Clostridium algidicarnis]MBU3252318.1 hypothetical protein [Clostridium algidicarnis]